jgi:membrane protease YdiL (CAAX protease family)
VCCGHGRTDPAGARLLAAEELLNGSEALRVDAWPGDHLNGFVGPIVEELYFRGYLLPRMDWMGRWAPLVNVSLFSLYHFWSPWQIVGRILGFGPTVYAVRWKENIYLGMVVHCTLNTLGIILVAGLVLGRI